MEAVLVIFGIIVVSFIIFVIYFIFKILQFVILAINLYKKILNRQDAMLKLLLDIRDNTKKYDDSILSAQDVNSNIEEGDKFICDKCKSVVPSYAKSCPKCGAEFE